MKSNEIKIKCIKYTNLKSNFITKNKLTKRGAIIPPIPKLAFKNPKFWVFLSRCEKAEVKVIKVAPVATPNKKADNTTIGKLNAVTNKTKPKISTIKAPVKKIL